MRLRHHKAFSDIGQDIKRYYEDGTADALETALKVAGRALASALPLSEPINQLDVQRAKAIVDALIVARYNELYGGGR